MTHDQRRPDAVSTATTVEPRLREILGGAAAFRALALTWAFAVSVVDSRSGVLQHRSIAFGVLAVLTLWTGMIGIWAQTAPRRLTLPATIAADVAIAAATIATDWVVYPGSHPQSFGSAWPVTAVVCTAAVLGWKRGLGAGLALGSVNVIAAAIAGRLDGAGLALTGSLVLLATTGAVAGYVSERLRNAESAVASARAREHFARTLHDGVLQTLAVVQRRSDDDALVEMAREQEWELREFIGSGSPDHTDLVTAVRRAAARAERHHAVRVDVVVIESPSTSTQRVEAMAGATSEAIINAAKHADPSQVTVCVDSGADGGVVVTITDDGRGFDVDSTTPGAGMARSIRGRVSEVGGTAAIRSRPGLGTEVRLWVP